jgi:serine/threonine-protein kinase SRPK3
VLTHPENQARFQALEDLESSDPSIPIETESGPVYKCRHAMAEITSKPILTDYGQMRLIDSDNDDWYMPDLYRAPEILLGLPWSHQVDIWSVGLMTLELLEGKNLFDPVDEDDDYVLPLALAQYIGSIGLPPKEMIDKSPNCSKYFDSNGEWDSQPPIPDTSLEQFVTSIHDGRDKELLLKFVRKMLTWDPDQRASEEELMEDEWLKDNQGP